MLDGYWLADQAVALRHVVGVGWGYEHTGACDDRWEASCALRLTESGILGVEANSARVNNDLDGVERVWKAAGKRPYEIAGIERFLL
jgi:hypothetical protein